MACLPPKIAVFRRVSLSASPGLRVPELSKINTFPIKGLRGYELAAATLVKAGGIGGDRKLAIATDADFDDSAWGSSRSFLINAVNDGLLKLNVVWDGSTVSRRNQTDNRYP